MIVNLENSYITEKVFFIDIFSNLFIVIIFFNIYVFVILFSGKL